MNGKWQTFGALAVALAMITGCSSRNEFVAQVPSADGIGAGAPVQVAGVTVGEVAGLGVQGDQAVLTLKVDDEIAVHSEACVLLTDVGGRRSVVLQPGTSGELHGAIPSCLPANIGGMLDAFREATESITGAVTMAAEDVANAAGMSAQEAGREFGRQAGEATRGATEGFVEGVTNMGSVRDLGEGIGMATREFTDGLQQGLGEGSAPAPADPPPASP